MDHTVLGRNGNGRGTLPDYSNNYHVGMSGGLSESRHIEYESAVVGAGLDQDHAELDDFPRDKVFSDLQAQLCPSWVYCYSIKTKTFYQVSVSRIKDVEWETDVLKSLVIEEKRKKMLVGLVQQHRKNKSEMLSDITPSKGKVRSNETYSARF